MVFLIGMISTLITSIVLICMNFGAIKQYGTAKGSFPELLPIDLIYDLNPPWLGRTVFYTTSTLNLGISVFFTLPVM